MTFGSEEQTLAMLVDTGSSWLWTYTAESCLAGTVIDGKCNSTSYFDTSLSTSFYDTGDTKNITYGSGRTEGDIVTDRVGMTDLPDIYVDVFKFLSVDSTSASAFQGILGLSPVDDSSGPLFVQYLYKNERILNNQFSILIPANPNFD